MRQAAWLVSAAAVCVPVTAPAQQAPAPATPQPAPQAPAQTSPVQPVPAPAAARPPVSSPAAPAEATRTDASQAPQAQAGRNGRRAADEEDAEEVANEVVVTGSRTLPGSVIGDVPPEVTLGAADIRALGGNSIADVLANLDALTGSTRGQGGPPVVLLNGRRISSFQEISDLPREVILRTEIYPEEVALKYGYRADQRVVNIVLRRRFRAANMQVSDTVPTEGGNNAVRGEIGLTNIVRETRAQFNVNYSTSSALTEAERNLRFTPSLNSFAGNVTTGGPVYGVPDAAPAGPVGLGAFVATPQTVTDPTPYRTLQGASENLNATLVVARPLGGGVSASMTGRLQVTNGESLQGLPTIGLTVPAGNPFSPFASSARVSRAIGGDGFDPLKARNSSVSGNVGTTLNGQLGNYNWTLDGTYRRQVSENFSDQTGGLDASAFQARINAGDPTANPFGILTPADLSALPANRSRSTQQSGQANAFLSGSPLSVPAGKVLTSFRISGQTSRTHNSRFRPGSITDADIARDGGSAQLNVDVPIASSTNNVLPFLGRLSVNGNAAVEKVSSFSTLTTYGYGLNWRPLTGVRLIVSHTVDENAPNAQQLGDPIVETPNVRVFDYTRGTTATVTTITGGNPALRSSKANATKIGLNLQPWTKTNLSLTTDYNYTRTDDPTQGFPVPSAAIEAAFPGRFTRDAAGNLLRYDTRPINFARREQSSLRTQITLFIPLRSAIQRQLEAFRAGTGPDPFAGLGPPGGGRRRGEGAPPGAAAGDAPQVPTQGAQGGRGAVGPDGNGQGAARGQGVGGRGGFGGGRGFGGGGGGFGGGRGGGGGGRLIFNVSHTWTFIDRQLIAENGPELDFLNGDAANSSGGTIRHRLQAQANYRNNGVGVRLSSDYRSATTVNGGTAAVPTRLSFGALTTVDLNLEFDFGDRPDLVRTRPFLRRTLVELRFDNLFNQRQRVRDAAGQTPIALQPAFRDALGRTVQLSLRKLFN